VTAWRKALDQLRRERVAAEYAGQAWRLGLAGGQFDAPFAGRDPGVGPDDDASLVAGDDQLRLMFACCHPALALEVRVALTLRYVAGLATREIAHAFVLSEPTMAQRLVRAKRKIRDAGISFELPGPDVLSGRVAGVQSVIYLIFNEGYASSRGDRVVRTDLCDEAISLGRKLHQMRPHDAETAGLLALMLLHHARSPGRQDASGRPVVLSHQDRGSWRGDMIDEGLKLLDDAMSRRAPGPYQLQAAIAAVHAGSARYDQTDWVEIAALYAELARRVPSPVVEVNRAVAVGMAHGPRAGLAILDPVLAGGRLNGYAPMHAAHAELLDRAGETEAAALAWHRAIEATPEGVRRDELRRRAQRHTRGNSTIGDVGPVEKRGRDT
jgi:RNA polymerase sigma-70 factor (ECF subfamily)